MSETKVSEHAGNRVAQPISIIFKYFIFEYKMKIKEIAETRPEDLKLKLHELEIELMKLNAQVSTGTAIKSPGQIKKIKKTIARIKTVLKTKEAKNTV